MSEQPSFWATVWTKTKAVFAWMGQHLLAPIVVFIVLMAGVVALAMGVKSQLGGLLGKLFGQSDPAKTIDVANSIDPDRIDKNGNLIPAGVPDAKGDTQIVVVPIDNPGLFSDPGKVVFTPPGSTTPIEVNLPDGVTAKDVEHIIVVSPEVTVVTVKDSSGITASNVDDLLKKYNG